MITVFIFQSINNFVVHFYHHTLNVLFARCAVYNILLVLSDLVMNLCKYLAEHLH